MSQHAERKLGRLYGVGVGPGDPELLTLRAHRLLRESPVICVPKRGLSEDGYSWGIVKGFIDQARQEVVPLEFPMTRDFARLVGYWERAVEAIWQRIAQGKDCVFVTEGDPLVYSTFSYVYQTMRERHPEVEIEIVPGVSSVTAAAARAGVSLADGDDRIAILPATYEDETLRQAFQQFDTVVLMKVNRVMDRVVDILESLGLVDRAVFVSKGTSSEEEVVRDIRTLRGKKLEYMSLVIVRKGGDGRER